MRKFVFIFLILSAINVWSQESKEVVVETKASEVTVFIKGAQVQRKATVNFPAGNSTIRFTNLSPYIDGKSIQVKVAGQVMVLSINHQLNHNDTIKQSAEVDIYWEQIVTLNEKITEQQVNRSIIIEELNFLQENKKIGGDAGISSENLKSASAYYGQRISELKHKQSGIDKKIKTLTDERSSIERKVSVVSNKQFEPVGEIILNANSKTALQLPVELSYYVNNAGWYPSYDILAKSISDPVGLVYKANIQQNTKEEWKNVKLKVSSANPNLGSVAPKLKTYFLDYYTKPPRYDMVDNSSNEVKGIVIDSSGEPVIGASVLIKGSTIGTISGMDGSFSLPIPARGGELQVSYIGLKAKTLPISTNYMNIILEEDAVMLDEVVLGYGSIRKTNITSAFQGKLAGVSTNNSEKNKNIPLPVMQIENTTSVEFEIKTPYTISSRNKITTVELENYSLPAGYEYYCIPKIDKDAFLLANISDWEQYNLLEGEANIFFEDTYIGKTILDVRYTTDTLNISLGRDKNVVVQREKQKDYTSKKLLGSKNEITRAWKITVKNNKKQPLSIVLSDQVPISTSQEIEISAEKLSGGELNKETGEVSWKLTLDALEKKEFEFIYKVKYPKGKTLQVE